MKIIFVLFVFISSICMADMVTLKIDRWDDFFAASGRTFIQRGTLVDFRSVDFSKVSCSTRGNGVAKNSAVGDLIFSKTNERFQADFNFQGRAGELLFLHCTSESSMSIDELNIALNPIASFK